MTAEEFVNQELINGIEPTGYFHGESWDYFESRMIEFAQYHVKQALLEASENAEAEITWDGKLRVEKATILECYPDDRIK